MEFLKLLGPLVIAGLVVAVFAWIASDWENSFERIERLRIEERKCHMLGGQWFENDRCYRAVDGQLVPVKIPPLPKESKSK